MSRDRKYEKVWDIVDRTWKTPEEIDYAIMHDKPRFISEKPNNMGDGGLILAFYKASTIKYKNGKQAKRKAYFKALKNNALNTYDNRTRILNREISRESEIHKMCKDLFLEGAIQSINVTDR